MKKKSTIIRDVWAKYEKVHLPNTRSAWRAKIAWKWLDPWFGPLKPEEVGGDLVEGYCDGRGVSGSTLNRELTTLAAVLSYGRKVGMTTAAPHIQKRPSAGARARVLTSDEQACLLAVSHGPLETFVQIALLTGQRREAITSLRWEQIDWTHNIVDFRDPEAPNSSRMKGRGVVPLLGDLRDLLARLALLNAKGKFVIEEWEGDGTRLDRPFKAACKAADIQGVTPHTLRHTVATRLVRRGVPLLEVSRLLGHKSVVTTEKNYLSLTPDYIANAAMQLTLL